MLTKLFSKGKIGKLELKNRIVMAPMATFYPSADGYVTTQMIRYYAERAKGGPGLIVVEATFPRREGYLPHKPWINDDRFIPGLKDLTSAMKQAGARVMLQLNTRRARDDGIDPVSASGVPLTKHYRYTGLKPRVLSTKDVEEIVEEFGEAVTRVIRAGFDGLMIHGAHGYLVSEFLSPLLNKRNDKYGGNVENRARLALELLEQARREAGGDFPIIFRLTVDERRAGGFSLKDAIVTCQLLEKAGVDAIDVVSGVMETYEWVAPPACVPRGYNVHLAAELKKVISVPVMVAGRINDPYLAEDILQQGKADFVDLGRALLADPQFPKKAKEGLVEDIRKCIACNECMNPKLREELDIPYLICAINPACGREQEFKLTLIGKAKNILVIGGGPAGMEAARIAALRGHEVTLWEKDEKLGGQLNLAIVPPHKEELKNLLTFLVTQVQKLGVGIELKKEATLTSIKGANPDAVVVATGSTPKIFDIPGGDRPNVSSVNMILASKCELGKRVIIVGGGSVGCETAEFLADKGCKVTIVTRRDEIDELAKEVSPFQRWFLIPRLRDKGIEVSVKTKAQKINEGGLVIIDIEGKERLLEADNIVLALGGAPNNSLFKILEEEISEVYAVGDCIKARRIIHAIHEGATVGLRI